MSDLVTKLATSHRYVDAAAAVCACAVTIGATGSAIMLLSDAGPPALAVDNFRDITDDHRLYCVSRRHWNENPMFAAMSGQMTLHDRSSLGGDAFIARARKSGYRGGGEPYAIPLLAPDGWFGVIVLALEAPPTPPLERELAMLGMMLSVWCTDRGVGRLPTNECSELSARQHAVARLAAAGRTNAEIAHQLGLSINTVKLRLKQAFERLSVNNRTELSNVLRRLAPLDGVPVGVSHAAGVTVTRASR
ncbi:MAG: hypothetical protein JO257_01635 [Deltaproteobacteria bacterium]|nr:hypothetical protein [Deltaproteobacteria bacterium]